MSDPSMRLNEAAETYKVKSAEYGDNYLKIGKLQSILFPNGLELITDADHNRHALLLLLMVKLTRYSENFSKGGHSDSLLDLSVYSAMLAALDESLCAS